ncbi:MAG: response regulator [Anaerolineales bacterium]
MIAEDERDIRDLITFTLRFAGHEVVATSNGEEAYFKAQEVKPDLVLMDVRMPRMTGYEACKKMKENPDLQGIPIVFLSAKGQEAEVQAGLEAGAVEYILKPFAPDQLTSRISVLLEQHKSIGPADVKDEPSQEITRPRKELRRIPERPTYPYREERTPDGEGRIPDGGRRTPDGLRHNPPGERRNPDGGYREPPTEPGSSMRGTGELDEDANDVG